MQYGTKVNKRVAIARSMNPRKPNETVVAVYDEESHLIAQLVLPCSLKQLETAISALENDK